MKIGFVGPANGHDELLREALDFLIGDADVHQAVYLGLDDAAQRTVQAWATRIAKTELGEAAFLRKAAALAQTGTAEDIGELLRSDEEVRRLSCVRTIPPGPARAVEMIGDRMATIVYDKGVLDKDDIANSTLLIYGKSKEDLLKRFGPRYFFTPGPLDNGKVGIVEADDDGQITVGMFAPSGVPLSTEVLQGRLSGKIMVSP